MQKVIQYTVVHTITLNEMYCAVNKLLLKGYRPQGGICVSSAVMINSREEDYMVTTYSQAMILFEGE